MILHYIIISFYLLFNESNTEPIRVPKRNKKKRKSTSKWIEEDNNDSENDNFKFVTEAIKSPSSTLRRDENEFKNPTPDPSFIYTFNEDKDTKQLEKSLKLGSHLSKQTRDRIKSFVIKYFDIFREEGLSIPVRAYEMVINTGDTPPIKVPLPHYGMHESPIMQKTIDQLLKLKFIKPDYDSP